MSHLILLIIFFYLINQSHSFSCTIATNEVDCAHIQCTWSSGICTGTLPQETNNVNNVFIYPSEANSQTPTGAPNNPFSDLTQALEAITNNSNIYIVQPRGTAMNSYYITKPLKVKLDITVQSLFADSIYEINFSPILEKKSDGIFTNSDGCILTLQNNNNVIFDQAKFTGYVQDSKKSNIFCCKGKKLSFLNSFVSNLKSDNEMHFTYATEGVVYFKKTVYENSNAQMLFNKSKAFIFISCTFKDVIVPSYIIKTLGNIYPYFHRTLFSNLIQQDSSSTFLLGTNVVKVQRMDQKQFIFMFGLQFNRNLINNVSCSFMHLERFPYAMVMQNKFTNINFKQANRSPFINFEGVGNDLSKLYLGRGTFENITVRHTFLFSQQSTLLVYKNTWKNISQVILALPELGDLDYTLFARSLGACITISGQSKLKMHDDNLYMIDSSCVASRDSQISLHRNIFNNTGIAPQNSSKQQSWVLIEGQNNRDSKAIIQNCVFIKNLGVPDQGGAIRIYSSIFVEVLIEGCKFIGLQSKYGGAIYTYLMLGSVDIKDSIFTNNIAEIDGGAVYLSSPYTVYNPIAAFSSKIMNCSIIKNKAQRNGGGIFIDRSNVYFEDSIISYNSALNGGGVYMMKFGINKRFSNTQHRISNVTINSNIARYLGPAMKLMFNLSSIFQNQQLSSLISMQNNSILTPRKLQQIDLANFVLTNPQNQISEAIPTIFRINLYEILTIHQSNINTDYIQLIANNTATKMINSFLGKTVPKNIIFEIKSGSSLPYIIEILVLDQNENVMEAVTNEEIEFKLYSTENEVSSELRLIQMKEKKVIEGRLVLKDEIEIQGPKFGDAVIAIKSISKTSSLLKESGLLMNLEFNIKFIQCQFGDIYDYRQNICKPCTKGTFSFSNPYSKSSGCVTCSKKAECLGGSQIAPKPGYYRYNQQSMKFLECDYKESCLGGIVNDFYYPEGKCGPKNYGPVCSFCKGKSAKVSGEGECIDCKNDVMYYIRFFGFLMIQLITILASIILNQRRSNSLREALLQKDKEAIKKVKEQNFTTVLIRITVNYFLLKSVINSYGFSWPGFVGTTWNIISEVLPTTEKGFSIDCFVVLITGNYEDIYFTRLVTIALKPILIFTIIFGFQKLYEQCQKRKQKNLLSENSSNASAHDRIILIILCVAYVTQTEVVRSCLNLFKCTNFSTNEDPIYFLDSKPDVECYQGAHLAWLLLFCIPLFILWDFILPYKLFKKVKVAQNDEITSLRYMFLSTGFKNDTYYWEFINLCRKEIIVFINACFRFLLPGGQALLSLLVLLAFLHLHIEKQPYSKRSLNRLESASLISNIVMLISELIVLQKESDPNSLIVNIFLTLTLITTLIFFILLGKSIIYGVKLKVKTTSKRRKDKQTSKIAENSLDSSATTFKLQVDRSINSDISYSQDQMEQSISPLKEFKTNSITFRMQASSDQNFCYITQYNKDEIVTKK